MRLVFDLRVAEDWAEKHLGPGVGQPLSQGPGFPVVTRQVIVDAADPLAGKIKEKVLASERRGESLFCFVNPDYIYDKEELDRATLLRFRPTELVRTYGQQFGTDYDDTNACPKCGAGRVQRSPLVIDPRFLTKKKKDFLVTIAADEWIVSARLASLLQKFSSRDCTLEPIHDPRGNTINDWFQLKVNAIFGSASAPTQLGIDYFHPDDFKGEYVCTQHCLSGLNLISELYVTPEKIPEQRPRLSITRNRVGQKAGWIVPAPFLLVTRRLADVLLEHKIRGFDLDIAHVV